MEFIFVLLASLMAGFVDSVVGGGGLVLMPALFAAYPNAAPVSLIGTNKGAAIWGTAVAGFQYSRKVQLLWRSLAPAAACAFIASLAGAWVLTWVDPQSLRKALPFLLTAVLVYTLVRKDMGTIDAPRLQAHHERIVLCVIAGLMGFYDGFFGPGTGSILVFLLVRVLGFDFLRATANTKIINLLSNLAALLLLSWHGHVWWHMAWVMAVANIAGSLVGTHAAMRYGTRFVRWMFIGVVSALIFKTAWDSFMR